MASAPSLGVAYLTVIPTLKGSKNVIEKELGGISATSIGGKLGSQLTSGLKSTATAAMGAVGVAAGVAFTKGFGRLRAIDTAQAKLKGLGNDAKTIDLVMQNAGASVKGTAFGLDAAATAAAGAMAAGIKPGQALERNLKLVADAATIAGTDMGTMGAIFNKAAASNKVQMDVINQLHDAGVPALSFLAKTMGVTAEEASKMASAGEINFAIFQDAMEQGLGGAALSSGDTFTGAMANVFAALGRIGAGIMGGVFPKIAPLFQTMQAALGPLEDRAAALGAVIGEKVTPVLDGLMGLLEGGTGRFEELSGVIGPVAGVFAALGASGLAPLLSMVPGLGGLAGILTKLGGPLGLVAGAFLGMVATSPELQAALGTLLGSLGTLAASLAPALEQIATILTGALTTGLGWLADGLTTVVGWLASFVSAIAPYSDLLLSLGVGIGAVVLAFKAWTLAGNTLKAATAIWKAAQMGWTAASYGAAGASYAMTAATKGQMIATKLATGAQRLFNTVLRANPLGIIITAITAVVGALTWFFTQTDAGKAIWAEFIRFLGEAWANISSFFQTAYETVIKPVFEGIGATFSFVWNSILKPVFDALAAAATWVFQTILMPIFNAVQVAFAILGGIFQGVWEYILKPVFDGIGAIFTWLWQSVISVIVGYIDLSIKAWGAVFEWLWTTILKPTFDAIGAGFNWIYKNVILPVVGYIRAQIQAWGAIISWLNANVVQPVFQAIGAMFNWIYQSIILPIVGFIKLQIQAAGAVFRWLYENAIKPALDNAGRMFRWLNDSVIQPVWTGIKNTIKGVWENGIKPVIDTLVKVIRSDPKKAFEVARDAIGTAWKGIQDLAKKPVRFVIETVINGLIGTVNKILPDGMKIPKVPLPKGFAGGGVLPGYQSARRDDVLMPMRSGEGVLVPEVVRGLGAGFVHSLNAVGNAGGVGAVRREFAGIGAGLARGGLVSPLPRGSYSVSQPYHGGHNGIDLAAPSGTKVFAAADGVVGLAGVVNMGGNEVYIQHPNGLGTRYSHLSRFGTKAGASVKAGNVIGYVGSTGMSTGPHLHYMVHNPGQGGGNYGAHVNPASYLGEFAKDLGEAGGAASILDGLVDWAVGQIKGAFPGGGMWVDVAMAMGRNAASTMAKAFNPFAASDGHTTLYDSGGLLQPGVSLVENRTGRPEPILTGSQWESIHRAATQPAGIDGPVVVNVYDVNGVLIGTIDGRIAEASAGVSQRALNDRLGVA
ncbi:peptidoglycan DD-metalloendopeptidase family protein [Leucobacter chromiiresistens]